MGLLSLFILALLPTFAAAGAEGNAWLRPWHGVPQLVKILETIPQGQAVLASATAKDPNFAEAIKFGTASYTESTFSRTYSLLDGKEQISLHHEVTLNTSLPLADAVVDLAHELIHLTEKGMLDPYRAGFELSHFIRNGIEGEGGELAALAVECRVAWSLEENYENFPQHRLCERYRKKGNSFNREAARLDYYSLGAWYAKSGTELKSVVPEINKRASVFTSSFAAKPYPVALAEEFAMTRRAACANNQRKYRLIASQSIGGRRPASTPLVEEQLRLRKYDRLYCRDSDDAN